MARNYDGVDQYSSISSTNYQTPSTAITIAGWFRWDDTATSNRLFTMRSSTGSFDTVWEIGVLNVGRVLPRIRTSTSGASGATFQSAVISPTAGNWYFYVFRWQASDGAWDLIIYDESGSILDDTKSGIYGSGETIDYTSATDIEFGRLNTQFSDLTVGASYVVNGVLTDLEVADLRTGGSTALAVSDLVFAFDGNTTERIQHKELSHFNTPPTLLGPGEVSPIVTIDRYSSPFDGPGSTILSCRNSTFSTDQLEEAQIEWFAYKDGVLIDSEFRGGGTPEFGVCTEEAGTYTVYCRIMSDESSGEYAVAVEEWTVSSPTFQAECWLDLDAGTDGSGTEGSPFNDPASAASYILSNHVDGATNQSAIHVRKGTTWSGSSAFISWALETMEGRLIIDTYDTGANPEFTLTADVSFIQLPDDMGIWIQDIDIIGNYSYGSATGSTNAIYKTYRIDGGSYIGLHTYILRCNISTFSGSGLSILGTGTESEGCVTNGSSDHFMLLDSTITDCGTGSLTLEQARYANISNNTFGRCQSSQNVRLVGGADTSWIRGNTFAEYGNSQIDNFNFHAQRSSIISDVSIIGNRFLEGNIVIKPNPSSLNAQTRYISDLWFVANVVDNRGNDGNGVLTVAVPYNLVIRHNQLQGSIQRIWGSGSDDVGSADGTATLITDGSDLWFDGNTFHATSPSNGSPFFVVPAYLTSGFRHRNNFYHNLSSSSGPELLDGVSRAAGTLITASDYNVRFPGNASSPWGQAFTDASSGAARTLAQWQTDTSLDLNSTDDVAGDPAFIDLTSVPMNLSLSGSSDAIDTAGTFAWARVDISGHIRSGTYDAGSFEFGTTEEPTPPISSGGGTSLTYTGQALSLNLTTPTATLLTEGDITPSAIGINITVSAPQIIAEATPTITASTLEISVPAPTISATITGTQVSINRYSSPFAGYGSVVLDCRDSTFATSRLEEAQIEWYAYKDNVLVDSLFKGGGCPEYGLAVEPGNWKVICRILTEDDAGVYAIATEEWTVSEPTYQAECWLDLDAVSNGTGTEGSPFNTPVSATAYIVANHVDGATNQSAIHIKKGTTYSGSSFVPLGGETMQGRIVIDTYDTGANPEITLTAATSAVVTPPNMGIWIQDIDIIGNYVWASTPGANSAIENQFDVEGTHTTGLNTAVLRCNFSNFDGHGVFNRSIGTDVDQYVTNGCADYFLLHDTTITDTGNGSCFGECSRYATTKGCTFNRNYSENNYRFSRGQPSSIIRDNVWNETDAGSHSNFRIHSVGNTIVSKLSIIGNTYLDRDPQVTADFDATPDSGVRHLRDIWFIANIVDNRANSSNGAMAWAVAYNSVIRHNQFYSEIPRFFTTRLQNIGSLDNSQTLITNGSDLWFEGNTCYSTSSSSSATYFDIPSWFSSGFRFRNNLFVFLATGGDPKVLGGGSRSSSSLITAASYNVRFCPDASAPWASAFTDVQSGGNATLSQFQTQASLESGSVDDNAGNADFVDVTGSPPDLDIGVSSDAIGISGLFAWARVDIHGNLRTDPYDVGADEFGTTSEPTPPSGTIVSYTATAISGQITVSDPQIVIPNTYDANATSLNFTTSSVGIIGDSNLVPSAIAITTQVPEVTVTTSVNLSLSSINSQVVVSSPIINAASNISISAITAQIEVPVISLLLDDYSGPPWWNGLTRSGVTAVITKNFTTTEAIPAHFNLSAWDSTTISAPAKCLYIWTVSGGSEHDGVYNGPNLGLVFETEGTFTVELVVIDGNSTNYDVTTTTVTVSAKPTFDVEYYVDSVSGNDTTGDGSSGSPFQTMAKALSELETNKASDLNRRILLTAGQTHTLSSKFTVSGYVGSFYIEKTGVGAKPIISGTITSTDDGLSFVNGVGDAACRFRLSDLSITAQTSAGNGILAFRTSQAATSNPRGHDMVCVRVDVNSSSSQVPTTVYALVPSSITHDVNGNIENFGNAAYYDCTIIGSGYATFAEWHKVTVLGGTWDSGNGPGGIGSTHVVRVTSSRDVSFRNVTVARSANDRLCMKIHHDPGAQDNNTMIAAGIYSGRWTVDGCTFISSSREVINFSPQDAANPEERVRYGVFSNNIVTLEGNTGYELTDSRFKRLLTIGASNVAVVNNRLFDHCPAEIDPPGDEPCTDIFIYNNSVYGDWTPGNESEMLVRINSLQTTDTVEILNNAVFAVSGNGDLGIYISGSSTGLVSDYNMINTDTWWGKDSSSFYNTLANWQASKSIDLNSQEATIGYVDGPNEDFTITSGSPGYSGGTPVIAALKTYNGRRDSSSWDIGAYAVDTVGFPNPASSDIDYTFSGSATSLTLSVPDITVAVDTNLDYIASAISLQLEVPSVTIDTEINGTVVNLTRYSSPFAGYGNSVLNCRNSIFATSKLQEAVIEWWAFKDGVLQDSMYVGGGAPDFGIYTDPGEWAVICKILTTDDAGVYAYKQETWTVSAPTYVAECWLDLDAGVDGTGTEGSPFNDPSSAASYILSNHVNGSTNQSAIHVKRGTTWTGSTAFFNWGLETLQGRVVIDTYGTGDRPTFTWTTHLNAITTPPNMGVAIIDIELYGPYIVGDGVTSLGNAITNQYDEDGTHTTGLNTTVHNCVINGFRNLGIFTNSVVSVPSAGAVNNGCLDFVAVNNTTFQNCGGGAFFVQGFRYGVFSNNTLYPSEIENNWRASSGTPNSCIRNNHWTGYLETANSIFRLHANYGTPVGNISIVGNRFGSQDPQITSGWGVNETNTMYLHNVWFVGNKVDNNDNPTPSSSEGCLAWGVPYTGVIRNNYFRAGLSRFFSQRPVSGGFDPTGVPITGGFDLWIEGNSIFFDETGSSFAEVFAIPSWMNSGVRIRNNAIQTSHSAGGGFINGGGRASSPMIEDSDYNFFYSANGSAIWSESFSDVGSSTLAAWTGATTFDQNSVFTTTLDPQFGDPTGEPLDLTVLSGSALTGIGGEYLWLRTDISGFFREAPYDIGAFQLDATEAPTPPTPDTSITGLTYVPNSINLEFNITDPTINYSSIYEAVSSSVSLTIPEAQVLVGEGLIVQTQATELSLSVPEITTSGSAVIITNVITIQATVTEPAIVTTVNYTASSTSLSLTVPGTTIGNNSNTLYEASAFSLSLTTNEVTFELDNVVLATSSQLAIEVASPTISTSSNITPTIESSDLNITIPNVTIQTANLVSYFPIAITNFLTPPGVTISAASILSPSAISTTITTSSVTLIRDCILDVAALTLEVTVGNAQVVEGIVTDFTATSINTELAVPSPSILKQTVVSPNALNIGFSINYILRSSSTLSIPEIIKELNISVRQPRIIGVESIWCNPTNRIPRRNIEEKKLGNIDFRSAIDYIKKEIGFRWAGLRRINYDKPCVCVTNREGSVTTENCTRCMQTGYMFTDYLVKVYPWTRTLGVLYNAEAGRISTQTHSLIIEHNYRVNKFDYYLELDLDPETGKLRQPFQILKYYEITDSLSILGDDSKVEYWKCYIEERTVTDGKVGPAGQNNSYMGNRNLGFM